MKKRGTLKKGHIDFTKKGIFVTKLADKLAKKLKPYCKKIKIVGSIRRHEKNPYDIDIVLIPKNHERKEKIERFLKTRGTYIQGGEKEATFKIKNVKVELYYTIPKEWGAELLAYSSKKGAGIGLRVIAKKKGLKLSQHGLFKDHKFIAGKTEEEIYKALERPLKPPEKR
ncbi:MAG: hypothetical protein AABW90_02725 [Nanoarchaeota archaeon]